AQSERVFLNELGALHERLGESLFGGFKIRACDQCASVCGVLCESRATAEGCCVETVDEEACLLELCFYEEGCGNFCATARDAGRVRAALGDSSSPVGESCGVRFAVEEIQIVSAHEELRIINRVRRGR